MQKIRHNIPAISSSKRLTPLLSGRGKAIPLFKVHIPKNLARHLQETFESGYVGEGPRVKEFEKKLSAWTGNQNVLALNSGTSALQLALRLANVGMGDEVISTPMTCVATNVPIMAAGARIVWADIDPLTGNIDPADVKRKITARTKAVIAVHWGGYPCDLYELNKIAYKYGVKTIEDAAHAFGAVYRGKPIGSHSDFTCFSFQAIKHLTTVDGGALTCRNLHDYKRGKLLRWYGINRESNRKDFRCEEDIPEWGYKYHMNDVNATIGLVQLKHVNEILNRHRDNANYYRKRFKNLPGLQLLKNEPDRVGSFWLFTMCIQNKKDFINRMKRGQIVVSQVHNRNDIFSMFRDYRMKLPGVETFFNKQVSIPVGWWLTRKERKYIADTVTRYCWSSNSRLGHFRKK